MEDLTGCANLYADGSAHVRHLCRRLRPGSGRPAPILSLPPRERRAVRAYSWLLAAGTTACLIAAVTVTIPVTVTILARAVTELGASSTVAIADGAAAVTVTLVFELLWFRTWWSRHGTRATAFLRKQSRERR